MEYTRAYSEFHSSANDHVNKKRRKYWRERESANLEVDWITGFQAFAVAHSSDDGRVADESDDRGNGRKCKSRSKDELQIDSADTGG